MSKISYLGNSGIGQIPANWHDESSQDTLFQNWPSLPGELNIGPLEPYGNPAYEGYGFPAAGYGQSRRKVVGLSLPKVASPQLSSNGWAGREPQGLRITPRGSLNDKSDQYSRATIGVLQGLGADALSNEAPSQQVQDARKAAAWKLISEMDRLYEVAKAAKPGAFDKAARTYVGLDAPVVSLNRLVRDYYPKLRPNLIGQEGVFEKLDAVVKKPERNWRAWVDAAKSLTGEFNNALGDAQTYTLTNLMVEVGSATLGQVAAGAQELGNRTLTILDWLTKPIVFIPVGLGLLGIFIYARSGGALVNVHTQKDEGYYL